MATVEEYLKMEQEFANRVDALCEDISPSLCDCSKCPACGLCKWLEENQPY